MQPQNAVFEGIRMSCQSGLHGWEVTDLKVTFTQAEYYSPVLPDFLRQQGTQGVGGPL